MIAENEIPMKSVNNSVHVCVCATQGAYVYTDPHTHRHTHTHAHTLGAMICNICAHAGTRSSSIVVRLNRTTINIWPHLSNICQTHVDHYSTQFATLNAFMRTMRWHIEIAKWVPKTLINRKPKRIHKTKAHKVTMSSIADSQPSKKTSVKSP